ncbi:Os11g0512700 [Oryza sativa Japonica Group]|uniref:Uncharacterized protein n=2 Tax=Oryza sativa subsp. japonica TaxID=39947 RepID=A0A8J8YC36_ORYSJ|nr:hypothetical protein OsJ_34017 [Oryza sativa Japonica Group]BAT14171.1 Os11g0512700 [Oryza sativa Japonica Group]
MSTDARRRHRSIGEGKEARWIWRLATTYGEGLAGDDAEAGSDAGECHDARLRRMELQVGVQALGLCSGGEEVLRLVDDNQAEQVGRAAESRGEEADEHHPLVGVTPPLRSTTWMTPRLASITLVMDRLDTAAASRMIGHIAWNPWRVVEMVADGVACMRWRERHTPTHGRMNRSASTSANGGHQPLHRPSPAAAADEVNDATQPIVDLHLACPIGQEGGDGPQKPHHENVPFPVTSKVLRRST